MGETSAEKVDKEKELKIPGAERRDKDENILKLLFRVGDLYLPQKREGNTSNRVDEEVDAKNCPCCKAIESRSRLEIESEIYKEERDVLDEEMWEVNEGGMKLFGRYVK